MGCTLAAALLQWSDSLTVVKHLLRTLHQASQAPHVLGCTHDSVRLARLTRIYK